MRIGTLIWLSFIQSGQKMNKFVVRKSKKWKLQKHGNIATVYHFAVIYIIFRNRSLRETFIRYSFNLVKILHEQFN